MTTRCVGARLSMVLWLSVVTSSAAKEVLPSLNPELAYHSVVDKFCIQGHSMRIYRIGGRIDLERIKHKLASVIPVGSIVEIEDDYLLAQWGNPTASRLISLWSVAPDQVEGVYSVLAAEKMNRDPIEPHDCFANAPPPRSIIDWLSPRLGLLRLVSIVDQSHDKPAYIALYSSWLGPNALLDSVKAAMKENGWIINVGHTGIPSPSITRTIHAAKGNTQIDLNVFYVQGTSVMYMIAR